MRMCTDFTRFNEGVERELHSLPIVSDILSQLSAGQVFLNLDANLGYWQVILEQESQLRTTFLTPWGRFSFQRMPFGFNSVSELYQRLLY